MPVQIAEFPDVPEDVGQRKIFRSLDVIWHRPCGVEVLNVDLSKPLPDATLQVILDAWYKGLVIVFPNQSLEPEDQLRFGRCIGELGFSSSGRFSRGDRHFMYISNIKENGEYVYALPIGEMMFHIDQCHQERPSMASILYAIKIPAVGGNTMFADMYRAYETLSPELKAQIEGKKAINVYDYDAGATQRAVEVAPDAPQYAHPVVRTHPVTGRRSLFVNRLMTRGVEGMAPQEAFALLDKLFEHMENPDFVYEHRWRVGDLLMWDNRCVAHARRDFDPEQPRLMRRITVLGDKPR